MFSELSDLEHGPPSSPLSFRLLSSLQDKHKLGQLAGCETSVESPQYFSSYSPGLLACTGDIRRTYFDTDLRPDRPHLQRGKEHSSRTQHPQDPKALCAPPSDYGALPAPCYLRDLHACFVARIVRDADSDSDPRSIGQCMVPYA